MLCDCPPTLPYFEAEKISLYTNFISSDSSNYAYRYPYKGEKVAYDSLGIDLYTSPKYVSQSETKKSFPFVNAAFACSCKDDGMKGSKERVEELTIINHFDFDKDHLKGDTINDLFDIIVESQYLKQDLNQFLQSSPKGQMRYSLSLKSKPEFSEKQMFEIKLRLSGNKEFVLKTDTIYFK